MSLWCARRICLRVNASMTSLNALRNSYSSVSWVFSRRQNLYLVLSIGDFGTVLCFATSALSLVALATYNTSSLFRRATSLSWTERFGCASKVVTVMAYPSGSVGRRNYNSISSSYACPSRGLAFTTLLRSVFSSTHASSIVWSSHW